ncbi:MAG TPA: glutathione peroxidase [Acetobacteraceae bacterium]|jgi:glutathione peroxidase
MSIYDYEARLASGEMQPMGAFRGQVLLIVNVASRCGFTPQYTGLQALHARYHDHGLTVLGFPCDQFGHQEPGSDTEIVTFCSANYGVSFPIFSKIEVNGANAHPLYVFLKREKGGLLGNGIKWNFTKFLVAREGNVMGRFPPTTTPEKLAPQIATELAR